MKRVLVVAAAIVAACVGPALAGARENAIKNIAQVFAATKICSRVEINRGPMLLAFSYYNIDFDREQNEVLAEVARQVAPWVGKPEDAACMAVLALYGPNGVNVRGLLKEK
jgi:hypothetical protein